MMDLAGGPDDAPAHSQGEITPEAATIATILQNHGYRTTLTGKWHLTPEEELYDTTENSAPSHANWPSRRERALEHIECTRSSYPPIQRSDWRVRACRSVWAP